MQFETEKTDAFFQLQIQGLSKALDSCKGDCNQLALELRGTDYRYARLKQDRNDVISYLKNLVEKKEADVASMQEHLASALREKEEQRDKHKLLLRQKQENQKSIMELSEKNEIIWTKIPGAGQPERQELLNRTELLKKQLNTQHAYYKEIILEIENKNILEHIRLQKEKQTNAEAQKAQVDIAVNAYKNVMTIWVVKACAELEPLLIQYPQLLVHNKALRQKRDHYKILKEIHKDTISCLKNRNAHLEQRMVQVSRKN